MRKLFLRHPKSKSKRNGRSSNTLRTILMSTGNPSSSTIRLFSLNRKPKSAEWRSPILEELARLKNNLDTRMTLSDRSICRDALPDKRKFLCQNYEENRLPDHLGHLEEGQTNRSSNRPGHIVPFVQTVSKSPSFQKYGSPSAVLDRR
ncbi:hypothetical protein O181_095816 [Austropuccinia psidii MF-1]|uniref:Uncharacterized protein n=1 Tax=Austropuccinia psidii MF-1 TaxID=1389203 RepID=A0A9Q3PDP2_9BASI|nr:hypothetical protein [Austropuccinia psidii MF-1]